MSEPTQNRVDVPFAQFVKDGVVRLHHFAPGTLGESFTTDPAKLGKNPWTQAERKAEGSPKTFFYLDPEADKEGFFGDVNAHYHVDYPAEKIYDVVADPEEHKKYAHNVHGLIRNLKEAGYHGIYYSGVFPTVALWHPTKVTRLARSQHKRPASDVPDRTDQFGRLDDNRHAIYTRDDMGRKFLKIAGNEVVRVTPKWSNFDGKKFDAPWDWRWHADSETGHAFEPHDEEKHGPYDALPVFENIRGRALTPAQKHRLGLPGGVEKRLEAGEVDYRPSETMPEDFYALARTTFGVPMRAPAKGMINGYGLYQDGGEFTPTPPASIGDVVERLFPEVRKRVRNVASRIVKLARGDDTEQGLHAALRANPDDRTSRLVYADWLEEHGDQEAARRLRWWVKVLQTPVDASERRVDNATTHSLASSLPEWARHLVASHYLRTGTGPIHTSRGRFDNHAAAALRKTAANGELIGLGVPSLPAPYGDPARVMNRHEHPRVALWARAAANHPDKPSKLARQKPVNVDLTVKGQFGRSPQDEGGRPLNLGELKAVEDAHELPNTRRLSLRVEQHEDRTGDQHPFTAQVDDIKEFLHHLSHARIPDTRARKILTDPKVSDGAKLTHLVAMIGGDYAAAPKGADGAGGSWYHGQVNNLEKHLHRLAAGHDHPLWGSMDETTGELKGKHDPAANHPGVVLMKAVLAATSGNQNPEKNTLSTLRAWNAGRRAGHPILGMPDFNETALSEWVAKLKQLHNIDPNDHEADAEIRTPGADPIQRAKWYAKWVLPHKKDLAGAEGVIGYKSHPAHVTKTGGLVWSERNDVRKDGPAKGEAGENADLPDTDESGRLHAKGWALRGTQTAERLAPLKALFLREHERNPRGTEAEHFRAVADWLLRDHTPDELSAVGEEVSKHVGANGGTLKYLKANTFDGKRLSKTGWFEPGEKVPGAFVLGPKFGAFFMNLNSNHHTVAEKWRQYLTADLWFTRNWARYLGTLVGKTKAGARSDHESPTPTTRKQMVKAVRQVCKELGVTPADLQADLWYHEQDLYRMLGADANRVQSVSYGGAADKYIDPNSPQALKVKLARGQTLHADLDKTLAGKTWKRHSKRVAIQKHGDGGISVFMHGKKVVTAWPDGTTKKHGGKFYKAVSLA